MNAYYTNSDVKKASLSDRLIGMICTLISFIVSSKTRFAVRAISALAVLAGFLVTVSRVNCGVIGFGWGIIICSVLTLIEICVISSMTCGGSEQ